MAKNTFLDMQAILNQLPDRTDAQVADLGCGNFGYFVFPLAKLVGHQGRVYAVDVLPSALKEIKKKAQKENLPQIGIVRSNLENVGSTKILPDSLNAAFLVNTLFQAVKSLNMVKEAARLLKPGGFLIVVDWNEEPTTFGPAQSRRIIKSKLIKAATNLGLTLKKEFDPGEYHYGLVFTKN